MFNEEQICKLSDKCIDEQKLKYGQLVEINAWNARTVCEVRSLEGASTANGILVLNSAFESQTLNNLQDGFVEKYSLKVVNKSNVSSISVVVYISDDYFVKNSRVYPGKINYYCKCLLEGKIVSSGLLLPFHNSEVAEKVHIKAIELISLSNKNARCCVVSPSTSITIEKIEQIQYFHHRSENRTVGPFIETSSLKSTSQIFEKASKMQNKIPLILVWGPNGGGKSTLVNKLAERSGATLINIDAARLMTDAMELKSILSLCYAQTSNNKKCFLLLRRVDIFMNQPPIQSKSKDVSDILNLPSDMFNKELYIFMTATNLSDAKLNFCRKVFVGLPSREERLEYFQKFFKKEDITCDDDKDLSEELASSTEGQNWKNINKFVRTVLKTKLEITESGIDFKLKPDDFLNYPGLRKPKEVHVAHEEATPVLGCEESKLQLMQTIFWPRKHMESLKRMCLAPDRAVLLYGEPGCGKTSLVRMLAHESKMTLFSISAADIYSPYFGNSEKQLIDVFAQAKASTPSILFFDEIDCLAGNRKSMDGNNVQNRVACTLFLCMDSIGCSDRNLQVANENRVVLIATTNIPENIDPSLKRRFDRIIKIELPNCSVRLQILKHYTSKMNIHSEVDLEKLAYCTESYSGADLECLCKRAFQFCMRDNEGKPDSFVEKCHFEEALKEIKKSFTKCYQK